MKYDLKSYQHRGIVVVFNHEKFDFDLEPRTGTTKDADRLQAAFKARGFLVLPTFNDKKHDEIKSILGNLSKRSTREAYGSVLIFALSHGLDGGRIAAKDKFYSASDLREPFLDNPAFKNKPLIFVHQACRGKQKETFASRKSPSAYKNGDELYSGQNDILLAFGTLEGHESFRHKELGSFYIQKMCDILEKGDDIEILDLLTATNCAVIKDCAKERDREKTFDKVQTATFKSSLLKRFVLSKCSTHVAEMNLASDEIQTPVECDEPQQKCEYRGPAIIFHDENHKTEANKFLESLKELNFSCQTVDHEPTDRELTNLSVNLHLEDCSCLFIGMFFAESRLNFLHSRLLEFLNNKICSYMNAKPKIFLLACKVSMAFSITK
ncbi:hypothetical protein B566_EDAN010238 [Ephemera danica]|nr:hypothetical protein B566_EDAN010238 [Ephemera danica]